jgi:hypothetical protein
MTKEQLTQAMAYQQEFESIYTSDERRAELLTWLQERAIEDGVNQTCVHCKKVVIYAESYKAFIEGHIYSYDGKQEYLITRSCEFCFDKIAADAEKLFGG